KAASLRDRADKLKKKKNDITRQWREKTRENGGVVDEEVIAEVVSKMTGVPLTRLSSEDQVRLLEMEKELHKRVVAQDEAVKLVCKAVRRSRSGLKDPKRPTATFLFSGPTGVGKTLLAKTLAEFMFGEEDALVQIDMSEYQERHNISRLIGAPPGYVGYEEGGQLTEKIRRRPYAVVLLDEIEKAHPDVYNMLLQIMEEGHLTDSFGRKVDFKNVVLIMTTNVGAQAIAGGSFRGFEVNTNEAVSYEKMKKNVLAEVSRVFKPEFIGRLDEIVVFHKLTDDNMKSIVEYEMSKVRERLKERGMTLILSDEAKQFVIEKARNVEGNREAEYGARPLRRAVEMYVEDPLAEELLRGEFQGKTIITVKVADVGEDKRLEFTASMEEPAAEAELASAGA
ncbi:MAG TPA: ATP-dependent Clp protease ATP-binding subunit, partial [Caulifigura sp.]|nr:ATP-dependent Clp protease ATP-binding subunit [Caulifigura sp.]